MPREPAGKDACPTRAPRVFPCPAGACAAGCIHRVPAAHEFMPDPTDLKQRIKLMLVDNLMLQVSAAELGDNTALFGPDGLGLDSVDALQLVVALEKNFRLKIADTGEAKKILQSVNTIAAAVLLAENSRKQ